VAPALERRLRGGTRGVTEEGGEPEMTGIEDFGALRPERTTRTRT
jgi:hypothetical protein